MGSVLSAHRPIKEITKESQEFHLQLNEMSQLEETMFARLKRRGVVASLFATAALAALTVPAGPRRRPVSR